MQKGEFLEAHALYSSLISIVSTDGSDENEVIASGTLPKDSIKQDPPSDLIEQLVNLYNSGDLSGAIKMAEKLAPQYPKAFDVWNIMGAAAAQLEQFDQAIIAFQKALEIRPADAQGYNNMGTAYKMQEQFEEAANCYKRALELKPDYAEAHSNLGGVLQKQGNFEEAIASCHKSLVLNPNHAEAHYNLGVTLIDLQEFDQAIVALKKAISLRPDYAEAGNNLGRMYWLTENFVEAFPLMEWRWGVEQEFIGTQFISDKPVWDGSDGEQVLVWREQGIGDEIMFSSMFSELNKNSSKIIVECDSRLIPLYKRSFSEDIEFLDDRNAIDEYHYDSQIALGSLPRYLRSRLEGFGKSAPGWLKADPQRVNNLRTKLKAAGSERIIGVSWLTKTLRPDAQNRNISLDLLASHLSRIPATFVSLQYGDTAEEILSVNSASDINIECVEEIDLFADIDGLAALISACDMVISIDNATVHLAGALGVDTRVLLPFMPDIRWGLGRSDSYWYNQLKLYRQEKEGDWSKPIDLLMCDIETDMTALTVKNLNLDK